MPHPLLNPEGKKIQVSARTVASLRKAGLLVRNRKERMHQIKPVIYSILHWMPSLLERPRLGGLRASSLERRTSSTLPPRTLRELGLDCGGPSVAVCSCRECRNAKENEEG